MTRDNTPPVRFAAGNCAIEIARVGPNRLLVTLQGRDSGALGDAPFRTLEDMTKDGPGVDLFIDLEHAEGATLDVSGSWAVWMRRNRDRFNSVNMLTGTAFVQLSAQAVKRFSELGERAKIYSSRRDFDEALAAR